MKFSSTPLSLLLLLMVCHSCQLLQEPQPKTELEKLPPTTQEGKDTFGCLINGKAWFTYSHSEALAVYQLGHLSVGCVPGNQSMDISLWEGNGSPVLSEGVYDLQPTSTFTPWLTFFQSFDCFYGRSSANRVDTIDGKLTITKFDKSNYIVSGLFEYTLAHQGCDTLKITDGRFDIKYAP